MPLTVGSRLGHYDVTALIGEGGMGQVYQATDTKLNRQVALKILPEAFASDPDRLARFQREAQVLASLNHPGIAAIYGLEEEGDTRALVLELVEGPTLADRIAQGPIPVDEALPIAKQIAEALEAAHEAGVIHRDLKPANIKVREDGTVKVLDFGLAKALDPSPDADPSQSPTLTAAATQMGVIMGTAAYMSPEQAAGQVADKRSDIWSFGVVLFEMLTGQRLFTGETVSHVLAKVLDCELDFSALPASTPAPITRLLRRCLERKRKQRLSDVGEALSRLEETATTPAENPPASISTTPVAQPPGWRQALPLALSLATVAAVITGLAVWSLTQPDAPRLVRFPLGAAPSPRLTTGEASVVVVSPDGTRVVYVSAGEVVVGGQLYVRQLDQLEAVPLRGGVGINPFFSPDGNWVGFRGANVDDNLYRVSILGGPPVTLSEGIGGIAGASWGPDETIVLASFNPGPLFRLPAAGGERQPLTELADGETAHRWPEFLPGGEAVLFTVVKGAGAENMEIWVLDLTSDQRTLLIPGGSNPHYAPTGHLVYGADGTLRAVPFDLDRLEVTGDPIPVLEGVVTDDTGAAQFSIAQDGSLAYVTGEAGGEAPRSLVWVDRQGNEEQVAAEPLPYTSVQLSPDGQRVVAQVGSTPIDSDLVVYDLARETPSLLTFDPEADFYPIWTPDGARIVWSSNRAAGGATYDIVWKAADGTGQVEHLTTSANQQSAYSWSADGQTLVMVEQRPETAVDIGLLSMDGEGTIEWVLEGPSEEGWPDVSPDGRWMAYTTNESGQDEVFVTQFPNVGDGRWKVSQDGGLAPQWGPDSRELFFQTRDGTMMVAANETESAFSGTPVPLFGRPYWILVGAYPPRAFDISPDGQQLLVIKEGAVTADQVEPPEIKIVLNWFEELTRLVPTE
jgi:serine/threonine-protein kinase